MAFILNISKFGFMYFYFVSQHPHCHIMHLKTKEKYFWEKNSKIIL